MLTTKVKMNLILGRRNHPFECAIEGQSFISHTIKKSIKKKIEIEADISRARLNSHVSHWKFATLVASPHHYPAQVRMSGVWLFRFYQLKYLFPINETSRPCKNPTPWDNILLHVYFIHRMMLNIEIFINKIKWILLHFCIIRS